MSSTSSNSSLSESPAESHPVSVNGHTSVNGHDLLQGLVDTVHQRLAKAYRNRDVLIIGPGRRNHEVLYQEAEARVETMDISPDVKPDRVGNWEKMPYGGSRFDLIVATQVLHHLKHPWRAVEDSYRVLRSQGRLVVTAPFVCPTHSWPQDYYRFTLAGMEALLTSAGFEVQKCSRLEPAELTGEIFQSFLGTRLPGNTYEKPKRNNAMYSHCLAAGLRKK